MPLFEFQQPFDGTQPEISLGEQKIVSTLFKGMVEDVMLRHIDHVFKSPFSGKPDSAFLSLRYPKEHPDTNINLWSEPRVNGTERRVTVRRDGGSTEYVENPETGLVTRHDSSEWEAVGLSGEEDVTDASDILTVTDWEPWDEGDGDEPTFILQNNIRELGKYIRNAMAGRELEKSMELNEQPVGITEIEGLLNIVSQAYCPGS